MGDELEGAPVEGPEDLDAPLAGLEDLDPQFAADVSEALPDLSDEQIAALQRAVLGLLGR
jgi:hypothetical protein